MRGLKNAVGSIGDSKSWMKMTFFLYKIRFRTHNHHNLRPKNTPKNIPITYNILFLSTSHIFSSMKVFLKTWHGKWSDESAKEFFRQSTYLRPGRDNDKVKFHREKQYRISEMEALKGK